MLASTFPQFLEFAARFGSQKINIIVYTESAMSIIPKKYLGEVVILIFPLCPLTETLLYDQDKLHYVCRCRTSDGTSSGRLWPQIPQTLTVD